MILCVVLAGCGVFAGADPAMRKNPNFRAGYDDGCAAASTRGANPRQGPYRDEELYKSDEAYRSGWSSGFSTCRDQGPNGPLDNPVINPVPR